MLWLAYIPYLAWSLIGTIWTMAHHRFTFTFAGVLLFFAIVSFFFKRRVGPVTVLSAIAGSHAFGAFALHAWLRLPLWRSGVFFAVSFALLLFHATRVMVSRRLA
jgi:hypothetical protein